MNWPLIILAIVVVAIAAYGVWAYNFLIRLRQRVTQLVGSNRGPIEVQA